MNDTATIAGIALNPEFTTFTDMDALRTHIMGDDTRGLAPLTARRFIQTIRAYTMNPSDKTAERLRNLARKVEDKFFSINRTDHYVALTMQGRGQAAINYIVASLERDGWEVTGVTTDCTPAPKPIDPNACGKCGGEGRLAHYNYIAGGVCFRCDGTGMAA